MKRRNLTIFLLLGVLIAASLGFTQTHADSRRLNVLTSTQDTERRRTENLIQLAYASKKKAHLTLSLASDANVSAGVVDEAETTFTEGEALLMLANATLHGNAPAMEEACGNHTLAQRLAHEAMHRFKVTMTTIMSHWEATEPPAGWRELSEAIHRAEDYVQKTTTSVEMTKTEYPEYNYAVIDGKLDEATQHLAWARANMTASKMNLTESELDRARHALIQINTAVITISNSPPVQAVRISNYVNTTLTNLLHEVQTSATGMGKNVSVQVATIQGKITEAETLATSGDIKGALTAINEAHRTIMDVSKNLTQAPTETTAHQR